ERAKERAEERIRQRKSEEEYRRNKIALARAMARLSVTKRKTTL
ncbi:MAG: ATP synthase delta/epsilon chain alpha-helix domain-containing protein, partial [Christensenellaceae bacterium]